MRAFFQKHIFVILFFLMLFLSVVIFLLFKFVFLNKPEQKTEVTILVEKVGEHMFLPVDEVPSIATVTDPEKLKSQAFFNGAKKGDKVLIYSEAKKAVLYDPNADKIVTIAPISLDSSLNTSNKQEF